MTHDQHIAIDHAAANTLIAELTATKAALIDALRLIERGLANTGTAPGQWMTRITKADAWCIAAATLVDVAEKVP
ncbi:MAG: hypothetical protein WBR29_07430 [Gammaproteobacteria bacterium]